MFCLSTSKGLPPTTDVKKTSRMTIILPVKLRNEKKTRMEFSLLYTHFLSTFVGFSNCFVPTCLSVMNFVPFLPPFTGVWSMVNIVVTYIVSSSLNHTVFDFPYISDTGVNGPGRCLFSLTMNITSALIFMLCWLKYHHFKLNRKQYNDREIINWLNEGLLWTGFVSGIGIYIVANIQEDTCFPTHFIGASLGIGVGTLYSLGQGILSLMATKDGIYRWLLMSWIRIAIGLLTMIICACSGFCGLFRITETGEISWPVPVRNLGQKALQLHLCSSVLEWIGVFGLFINLATYYWEFRHLKLKPRKVIIKLLP